MPSKDTEQFLSEARAQFQLDWEAEQEIRAEVEKDDEFVAGNQWRPEDRAAREAAKRPVFTFNRLPTFVQQVANEARSNDLSIKVDPVEDGDVDTATGIEEITRGIEYNSHAEVARSNAVECSASGGVGYYAHTTEYCSNDSFDQDIKIVPILDPLSIYGVLIPTCFGRPVDHAFQVFTLSKDQFRLKYGKRKSTEDFWSGGITVAPQWITQDGVQVARYWNIEYEKKRLVRVSLPDGSELEGFDVPDGIVLRERTVNVPHVKVYIINGAEILEETDWAGDTIPIYPVLGKVMIVKGKPMVFSLVRFMREPQMLINFTYTRSAESLAVAPISPYMGVAGQFAGHEQEWATANSTLRPYLEYESVDLNGKPAPPPSRQVYETPIIAYSNFAAQQIDNLKAISGIFDSSLGNEGNERSGIAIARRQSQSGLTNRHFIDNLVRSLWVSGRDLVNMIPKIYDTARQVRAVGSNNAPKIIAINQPGPDGKSIMLQAGRYDVRVTTGPSFTTARAEGFARVTEMAKAYPELMAVAGDIVMGLADIPKSEEIAKRLKKMIPAAQEEGQPNPQQLMQKLQQSGQMIEAMTQQINQLSDERDAKTAELESRERIALLQEETKRVVEFAKIDAADGITALKAEVDSIRAEQQMAHQRAMHTEQIAVQREAAQAAPAAQPTE